MATTNKKTIPTYSDVFAQTMLKLARENPKLVVITPAMPEGNSLEHCSGRISQTCL